MMDVRERAVSYLNIKPRTKVQVIKYLRSKGFDDGEIIETVKELEEYHYIDDLNYSIMYFEYGFEKGRGLIRIKRELEEKGVSTDIIEAAYDELEQIPDQYEAALDIARGMLTGIDTGSLDYTGKQKLKAKIGRRLSSRGFSMDVVYKVINEMI